MTDDCARRRRPPDSLADDRARFRTAQRVGTERHPHPFSVLLIRSIVSLSVVPNADVACARRCCAARSFDGLR